MTDRMSDGARTHPGGRLLLAAALLAALVAPVTLLSGGAQAAAGAPSCVASVSPAGILGMVPAQAPSGCTGPGPAVQPSEAHALGSTYDGGNPPLLYGGGPVVGTAATTGLNTVHAVFWAPVGYSFPAGYEDGVDTFLTDVAADSGGTSNVYSLATQYTDGQVAGSPHLSYAVQVGSPVVVTDAYPTSGTCTPDTTEPGALHGVRHRRPDPHGARGRADLR